MRAIATSLAMGIAEVVDTETAVAELGSRVGAPAA
jgi:hypothetical protein